MQVRGFLAFFSQLLVTGHAFDKCTACSAAVVREYRQRGPDFLLQVSPPRPPPRTGPPGRLPSTGPPRLLRSAPRRVA